MKHRLIKIHDCGDVAKHLCGNLDEGMHSEYCREIRKHLSRCPNCTAYLDSLKKTISLYRAVPGPKAPRSARRKLFAVLKIAK